MAIVEPMTTENSAALVRSTWEERERIAKIAAATGLVPKAYQGRYEDCLIAMQYGAEIGLPPMAALQSIAVINGKPGLFGDGFLGVVMATFAYSGHAEYYVLSTGEETYSLTQADLANDETRAVAKFYRRGVSAPFVGEFSIADAKRARLWNRDGPWQQYPARMLKWRAREYAARDGFAAELRGIQIAELIEPEDVPTIEAPIIAPIRRSEKQAAAITAPPPTPEPEPEPPEPTLGERWEAKRNHAPELPEPSKPAPPIRQIKPEVTAADSVVITDTALVTRKGEESYYEIRARIEAEGKAPIAYVFLTRDKALYELAASAEGSPQTFAVTWRNAKKQDGAACKILESIEAS